MKRVPALSQVSTWLLADRGSSRPLALFRIVLVALLWARLAEELAWWNADSIHQVLAGLAFFVLTSLALVGWQTRRVMALLAGVMALVYFHFGLNLGHAPFTHHHVFLLFMCTLLTALGPCGHSFSIDRWRLQQSGRAPSEQGSLTANRLMVLQLAAVYLWTAVDKTNAVFLSGVRLDQVLHFHYDETLLAPALLWPPLVISLAVCVVAVEYFLALAILLRRWLPAVFVLGLALHGVFYLLLPVQTFSATMLAMYLFLIDPARFHAAVDRMIGPGEHSMKVNS